MNSESSTPVSSQAHLEPFCHQVAGQSLVFRYDRHTICKSLIPREHQFYKTLPDVLIPHVPEYRGVVDIPLNGGEENGGEAAEGGATHPLTTRRLLDKVARPSQADDNVYHFILLENIVADLKRPCILDLKMGTRQHGDDAPAPKVAYQVNKCRTTTSSQLGVRMCGMKMYQPTAGEYVQVDKAEGRRLGKDGFREAMRNFLFNGRHIRRDLIPSLLHRLRNLQTAIAELPSYRFYSSSLLVVYDGADDMCDCLHSVPCGSDCGVIETRTPCCGYENENDCRCGSNGMPYFDQDKDNARSPLDLNRVYRDETTTTCESEWILRRDSSPHEEDGSSYSDSDSDGLSSANTNSTGLSVVTDDSEALDVQQYRQSNGHGVVNITTTVQNGIQEPETSLPKKSSDFSKGDCAQYNQMSSSKMSTRNCQRCDLALHKSAQKGVSVPNTCVPTDTNLQEGVTQKSDSGVKTFSPESLAGFGCGCSSGGKVDVRMVDFAHTTFDGFPGDNVVHSGTDHGYLLGLQTLIDTFEHLYTSDSH
ncbi:hypothetical protein V1264_023967 [Littorina saxatilis]|uniref:Kinase n=2 Tax=Littorina saxatilis TaxID=31220 RepID=A0AAN9B9B8_9CAEN